MNAPINEVINYARLAPSVHNTQPWRFAVDDTSITLFIEPSRALDAGDPTTRELWVSLGVCLETILQAAKGLGFKTQITNLQTSSTALPVARILLEPSGQQEPEILSLLKERHSYRGKMQKEVAIPSAVIDACKQTVGDISSVSLAFVNDEQQKAKVAEITQRGMQLALSSVKFRKELAPLLNYNWSKARVGLHGFVLNHGALGSIWEKWSVIMGLGSKGKAEADKQRVLESSGLLFILSTGDVPSFWLDVGRAYMRVVLEITRQGFAHSTLTAPVEAARFHEDIEAMLHTSSRIQSMIRVGKATTPLTKTSPRLSAEELTT